MHLKRLTAGLRPDPLGELTALPQTLQLDFRGRPRFEIKEGEWKRQEGRTGKEGGKGKTGGGRQGEEGKKGEEKVK